MNKAFVWNGTEYSDEELKERFDRLGRKGEWDKECRTCRYPKLLHDRDKQCLKPSTMENGTEGWKADLWEVWSEFKTRMDVIVNEHDAEMERDRNAWEEEKRHLEEELEVYKQVNEEMQEKQAGNDFLKGMKDIGDAISSALTKGNENLIKQLQGKPSKLVKPAKVPSWTKSMKLEAYLKALEVWTEMNKDVSEAVRFQDVIESLKINKDIEGLAQYVGEHVIPKLDTIEKHTVKEIVRLLKLKYGRTRIEELEELMEEWIKFNFNEHESEEEYLFAMEKMIARKEEKKVTMREWDAIWMMIGAKKRKGIENYQLLELRKVVKENKETVQSDFREKYRELKVESNRGETAKTYYMGKQSLSRQRYHEQRIRRDSQGRDFYQDKRGRNDSRGRPFFRRYYMREQERPRSFSRDMRSISRNGRDRRYDRDRSKSERGRSNSERGRNDERRSGSKENKVEYNKCVGCKCKDCEKMRKNAKELNVQLCEGYDFGEEILVNFTEKGKQVMILDLGAPVSLAGNEWMDQYLKDHGLEVKDLKSSQCNQIFRFGPSKQYVSKIMVELPIRVRRLDGKEDVLRVFTYLVDADVPFLCGKREMKEKWNSKIDTKNMVIETEIEGKKKDFKLIETGTNHVAIVIEKNEIENEEMFFATYFAKEEGDLTTFKAIRKVHEVTNHKSAGQLLKHYRNAGLIGPNTGNLIKQVVRDCKICQKFGKSLVKPKVALPRASAFNEIVTLDLKQFGEKYVLWCIDACTRFVQGKLLRNKKAETIVEAINECWNLPFGIPGIGYYADNGTEFKNLKMDELVSKLGISISYSPAYSPWSNGINERNHASCDMTIKKLMEDKKIGLSDVLVKTAAWTHNTNVNRAGYSPLTLVTGKAVSIPGLTMGNEGSESLTDAEVVRRIMETMHKVTKEFREVETRMKLKECQEVRVRSYQHKKNYVKGDKVWYQYKDGNAWYGPGEVIYQKGNTVFMHSNGDVKKVAVCKVKPYELIERDEEEKDEERWNKMIEEDSKVEYKEKEEEKEIEEEEKEDENEVRKDLLNDVIGAKYLQVEKSVYFMDHSIFTVEVPVREHGKLEIIEAKNKEIENLKTYETFEEVKENGQETIGSRWIVTEKEKHDGQKQAYKARLVAKGFQEIDQPQSDSPTAAKESFKLLMALAANQNFKVVSMDIRAAFLQAKKLDREVFVRPPDDIKKEGVIWKLLKPLYGLDDASRKFYLKVKETLQELGLKTLPGDDAFYYENRDGKLMGLNLSHVDDFTIAGNKEFVERIVNGIKEKFTVSKIEEDKFRFTGLDVKVEDGKVQVSMEDYADSVNEIKEIRKADRTEKLTRAELKEYRKYTGRISWLSQGTRPDLSYSALKLAKKNNSATIADLRSVNKIVEKIKKEENKVIYGKVAEKENMQIVGLVDASYKSDEKSIGGMLIVLANEDMTRASPIMWKSKQIDRVCHSSKDAETLAMSKLIDELVYMARQVEMLLFGSYEKRIPVRVMTDSEPTLESIASTKQVERKGLRMTITELKEKLLEGEVKSYQWLSTKEMWADGLTKEMEMAEGLRNVLRNGRCEMVKKEVNKVVCENGEIKMLNIRNRKQDTCHNNAKHVPEEIKQDTCHNNDKHVPNSCQTRA